MLKCRSIIIKITALSIFFTVMGCAIGDPFNAAKNEIPTLQPGKARIFVYRPFNPLALLKPLIFELDSQKIGDTYASTIFYHDVVPGKHSIQMGKDENDFTLNIEAGKTVYVRFSLVSDAVSKSNYQVTLVDSKTAEIEIENLFLIKKALRHPEENK